VVPVAVEMDLSYLRVLVQLPKNLFLLHSLMREVALISHPVQETTLWSAGIFVCLFVLLLTIYDSLCLQIQGNTTTHYTRAGILALLHLMA
jgi:hypothetical protein